MIHQLYKKQVEAWKERFPGGLMHGGISPDDVTSDLLSSRHKDTIELIEATKTLINSVSPAPMLDEYLPIVKTGNMDKMFDYAYEKARKDFLIILQAELEIIKKES